MAARRAWDDDDGRVIADMSDIGRPALFLPHTGQRKDAAPARETQEPREQRERPWETESGFTPQERRMYLFGAIKASLLIALVYIVGLGAAVWLLLQLWT